MEGSWGVVHSLHSAVALLALSRESGEAQSMHCSFLRLFCYVFPKPSLSRQKSCEPREPWQGEPRHANEDCHRGFHGIAISELSKSVPAILLYH